jgi:hypothetical protein
MPTIVAHSPLLAINDEMADYAFANPPYDPSQIDLPDGRAA